MRERGHREPDGSMALEDLVPNALPMFGALLRRATWRSASGSARCSGTPALATGRLTLRGSAETADDDQHSANRHSGPNLAYPGVPVRRRRPARPPSKGLAGSCNRVEMAREALCRVTTISCHVPGPTLSFRPANRGSLSQQNTIEYHCLGDATVRIQRRNGSSSRAAWYPTSMMFIRHGPR